MVLDYITQQTGTYTLLLQRGGLNIDKIKILIHPIFKELIWLIILSL